MSDTDPYTQLAALARHMGTRKYMVDQTTTDITVKATGGDTPLAVKVTCEPRPTDSDRLWFWTHWGEPLAEATDITGAVVALVGLLTVRS